MSPKEEILKIKDGECWVWSENDYGKAEIWRKNNTYFLFEIPTFGGEPVFVMDYRVWNISQMIKLVESWT